MNYYLGRTRVFLSIVLLFTVCTSLAQGRIPARLVQVDSGWAKNSLNTVIFRKNSLVTHKNIQYISFYDAAGFLVIGKRRSGARSWVLKKTSYKGNTADAHMLFEALASKDNSIALAI